MKIETRKAVYEDLSDCLEVEKSSTPGLQYLNHVKDLFFNAEKGEFIVALADDKIVGMGNLSVCYDGSAWLETLRVAKHEQAKGIGKAIWKRYMEVATELKVPAVRMYTNISNVVSAGLAVKNGLKNAGEYTEASLMLKETDSLPVDEFKRIDGREAAGLLSELSNKWGGFMIFNRTFYVMDEPLYKGIANEGKVYACDSGVVVLGSRFMEKSALHIGIIDGDLNACIRFAIKEGLRLGVPKLVIMYPVGRNDINDVVEKFGFVKADENLIVMERKML